MYRNIKHIHNACKNLQKITNTKLFIKPCTNSAQQIYNIYEQNIKIYKAYTQLYTLYKDVQSYIQNYILIHTNSVHQLYEYIYIYKQHTTHIKHIHNICKCIQQYTRIYKNMPNYMQTAYNTYTTNTLTLYNNYIPNAQN